MILKNNLNKSKGIFICICSLPIYRIFLNLGANLSAKIVIVYMEK
jgi:hypothetical protein